MSHFSYRLITMVINEDPFINLTNGNISDDG